MELWSADEQFDTILLPARRRPLHHVKHPQAGRLARITGADVQVIDAARRRCCEILMPEPMAPPMNTTPRYQGVTSAITAIPSIVSQITGRHRFQSAAMTMTLSGLVEQSQRLDPPVRAGEAVDGLPMLGVEM